MLLSELEENKNFDFIKVRILSKQGPKYIKSRGRHLYVWDLLIRDQSQTGILSLWGKEAGDGYRLNSMIRLENGWCKTGGEMVKISLGKEGKIFPVEDDPNIPRTAASIFYNFNNQFVKK